LTGASFSVAINGDGPRMSLAVAIGALASRRLYTKNARFA
jgi:hypothetical protein